MKSLKAIPRKEKVKYPALQKITEENQDIYNDVRRLVADRQKEVEDFYKGAMNHIMSLAEGEGRYSEGVDPQYLVYEKMKVLNSNIDTKANPQLKKHSEEQIQKIAESFGGTPLLDKDVNAAGSLQLLSKRQNMGYLRTVQLISYSRFRSDPHVRPAVLGLIRYLFGNGIKISCDSNLIESKLKEKLGGSKFQFLMKDCAKSSILSGESGILIRSQIQKNKKQVEFSLQEIYSEEIDGVETSNKNTSIKIAYRVGFNATSGDFGKNNLGKTTKDYWIPDIEYFDGLNSRNNPVRLDWAKSKFHGKNRFNKNEVMLFMKFSNDREIRGEVQIESILRAARLFEDFLINRAILNYERSKVIYTRKRKTGGNPKLSMLNKDKSPAPKGGTQLWLDPGEEFHIETPQLHAADAERDGLLFLYEISSGMSMPLSIIGQRLNEANYNSIKNADSPFSQMVLDYAVFYIYNMQKIFKFMLKRMIEAGELPKTTKIKRFVTEKAEKDFVFNILKKLKAEESTDSILSDLGDYNDNMEEVEINTEDMPIDIIIADAVRPDPLDMAKVWFIYRKLGLVSRETLAGKAGFVWEQELFRQFKEKSFFDELDVNASSAAGTSDNDPNNPSNDTGVNSDSKVDDGSGTQNEY